MHFSHSVKGINLTPGTYIITNQSYARIVFIDEDFIYTDSGKRKFYPDHFYPTFVI